MYPQLTELQITVKESFFYFITWDLVYDWTAVIHGNILLTSRSIFSFRFSQLMNIAYIYIYIRIFFKPNAREIKDDLKCPEDN